MVLERFRENWRVVVLSSGQFVGIPFNKNMNRSMTISAENRCVIGIAETFAALRQLVNVMDLNNVISEVFVDH
jgi:hypothetical protein